MEDTNRSEAPAVVEPLLAMPLAALHQREVDEAIALLGSSDDQLPGEPASSEDA